MEEVVNMLAEKAMNYGNNKQADLHAHNSEQYVHEVLDILPKLQYGMDVNPKFTNGPTGMEFTTELTTFDLLNVKMVHGWLLDPQSEELTGLTGCKTYNELIETVIHGNEASAELHKLEEQLKKLEDCSDDTCIDIGVPADDDPSGTKTDKRQSVGQLRAGFKKNQKELSQKATVGSLINNFLESSGHQLTQYGLGCLHEHLSENELCVFFRNNHFSTLTKHEGLLYLLVTDLGYANVPNVVWEKIDVIDGDTEYVDAGFSRPGPQSELSATHQSSTAGYNLDPEQLLAQRGQSEADYQFALQLSGMKETAKSPNGTQEKASTKAANLDDREGNAVSAAMEASLLAYNGMDDGIKAQTSNRHHDEHTTQEDRDRLLAMQMQAQMEQQDLYLAKQMQETEWAQQRQAACNNRAAAAGAADAKGSGCVIS